jgi:hypothetical protein
MDAHHPDGDDQPYDFASPDHTGLLSERPIQSVCVPEPRGGGLAAPENVFTHLNRLFQPSNNPSFHVMGLRQSHFTLTGF